MNMNEMKTCSQIRAASLALMMIALPGIGSSWAASPEAQPAEPEQLRGLPKPKDLPLAQGPFQPTQASLDEKYHCPEWFADAKLGFWAHWGPQSVGMNGWYAKRMYDPTFPVNLYQQHIKKFGHPSKVGYKDTIPLFTAEKFDPEGLMAEFKQMGARLFLSMGVHHDNYDMWNSKYHRWNAMKIGPHKDIVGLWQQAAKKQGLRFGVSTHLCPSYDWWNINKSSDKTGPLAGVPYDGMDPANWDLYHPPHPGDQELHAGWGPERNKDPEWWKQHCFRRMYDLVTTYQPDFVNENDGGKSWGDAYDPTLVAHYYNMSAAQHGGIPDVVWYGKEGNGKGSPPCGEFGLPKLGWRDFWEQETSICGWFYEGNPPPPVDSLVRMFVEVICRNGIFLISFPQRADGTVPEDHMNCLRDMGKWVRLNEDGIFSTRPWRLLGEGPTTLPYDRYKHSKETYFKKDDIRFTRKKDVIYAFLMNPTDDKVLIRSLGKKARLTDGVPQAVRLLGYEGKLNWSQEDDGLKVQLPAAWVSRMIPVIEIRGFAAWEGDIRPGLDGALVLSAYDAQLNGTTLKQVFGRDFIEGWRDPTEWLSWNKTHLLEAGEYEVTIDGGGLRADVPYRLQIGDKELTGKAPAAAAWNKGVVFPVGKLTIDKAGIYPVVLRAGAKENWGGLQLFNLTLKRIQ
jgi:alpha-L-fucosidase